MRTYIKKLQSKSENTRKQIFVGSLIVCMSLVGIIWISSLGYRFNKANSTQAQEKVKPFALLGQTISNTYSGVTASVGNVSSSIKKAKNGKQIDLIPVEYQ